MKIYRDYKDAHARAQAEADSRCEAWSVFRRDMNRGPHFAPAPRDPDPATFPGGLDQWHRCADVRPSALRFDDEAPDLAALLAEANNVIGGLVAHVELCRGPGAQVQLDRVAAYRRRLQRALSKGGVR